MINAMKTMIKAAAMPLCVLTLQSCSTSEDGSLNPAPTGTVTLEINGAARTSLQGSATATFNEGIGGQSNTFAIAAGFTDFSGNNWTILLLISSDQAIPVSDGQSWDQDTLGANTTFTATYSENFDITNDFFRAEYQNGQPFSLSITSVDFVNETITGEFSLEIRDTENNTYQITNGSFNQIGFIEQ